MSNYHFMVLFSSSVLDSVVWTVSYKSIFCP